VYGRFRDFPTHCIVLLCCTKQLIKSPIKVVPSLTGEGINTRPTLHLVPVADGARMGEPAQRQYCLKWNNHPHNVATVFDRLRAEELFVDVTLATADRQVHHLHFYCLTSFRDCITGGRLCGLPSAPRA
jgi:hypothetical protein